jgi:hypothetical protein
MWLWEACYTYTEEVNATPGKKILHFYFLIIGILTIILSSLLLYIIVANPPRYISMADEITPLSFVNS